MSFGTGHNETTQLILEFLVDKIDINDNFMLDYGCGTGILSIAAVKLGVKKVMAIDIDEDSIQNAEEYIDNNHVKDEIKLFKGDISDIQETGFDIICANIIRSVIEDNLNFIYSKLKYNGKLFISGVLIDEQDKILASLNKYNFKIENIIRKAEWLGIYAKKK